MGWTIPILACDACTLILVVRVISHAYLYTPRVSFDVPIELRTVNYTMVDSGVSVPYSFASHFDCSVLERIILSVDVPMQKRHL